MSQVLSKAISTTLRTGVVENIRDAIVSGVFLPGTHLKESDLAEQMSVSRSPVREALRQLEEEGLIIAIPNQGCYVKTFTAQEIEEIFTIRGILENLACELIIRGNTLDPSAWNFLEDLILAQKEAAETRDYVRLIKLDMDFHEYLCKKSGFQRLLKMWQSLRGQIQMLFYQRLRALQWVPGTVDTDHTAILKAMRLGDLDLVSRVNNEIYQRVASECISVIAYLNNTIQREELNAI